jgi:hypothetical protein
MLVYERKASPQIVMTWCHIFRFACNAALRNMVLLPRRRDRVWHCCSVLVVSVLVTESVRLASRPWCMARPLHRRGGSDERSLHHIVN